MQSSVLSKSLINICITCKQYTSITTCILMASAKGMKYIFSQKQDDLI